VTAGVAIIDSGGANIASLLFAFERLGQKACLTTEKTVIESAERVILPGVGAARDAMQRLRDAKLVDVIRNLRQPVLGICLGMQLLAEASEEEDVDCLGIIPGVAKKLSPAPSLPVPNMGWCKLSALREHAILRTVPAESYFYFVHSYALPVSDYTVATAEHEQPFSAIIARENFVAAQFHPERSSKVGATLLRNFTEVTP
jgi:glutamine amidotransferase